MPLLVDMAKALACHLVMVSGTFAVIVFSPESSLKKSFFYNPYFIILYLHSLVSRSCLISAVRRMVCLVMLVMFKVNA